METKRQVPSFIIDEFNYNKSHHALRCGLFISIRNRGIINVYKSIDEYSAEAEYDLHIKRVHKTYSRGAPEDIKLPASETKKIRGQMLSDIDFYKNLKRKTNLKIWDATMDNLQASANRLRSGKKVTTGTITDSEIQSARGYKITNLLQTNDAGFAKCPFHNEKTPSMKVYEDNHAYCFGCHKQVDVISLYMHINNTTFVEAVRALSSNL
jgi:hypothetical protein